MKSSPLFLTLLAAITLISAAAASAASIDMDDPRRSLGREGDVRIDAQLLRDTVSPGTPIGITYQIQNLSADSVAVADRVADASYDEDTHTITIGVGSEVPPDGNLPHMVVIKPGEKRVITAAAMPVLRADAMRASFANVPRYVQVKVAILRDIRPYATLIEKQSQEARARTRLSDELFDRWFESNDTIFLNSVPVRFQAAPPSDLERHNSGAEF